MEIFAISCLIAILVASHHVLNWVWRWKDQDLVPIQIMVSLLTVLINIGCIRYIILWGYPLIA